MRRQCSLPEVSILKESHTPNFCDALIEASGNLKKEICLLADLIQYLVGERSNRLDRSTIDEANIEGLRELKFRVERWVDDQVRGVQHREPVLETQSHEFVRS